MTTKPQDAADSFLNEGTSSTTLPPPTERKEYQRQKRKLPASLDITDKCLPPLTRRKMAVYELLGRDKRDLRIQGGQDGQGNPVPVPQTIEPPPFEFAPTYQFEDRGEEDLGRRRKTMVFTNDIITYNKAKTLAPKELTDLQLDIPTFVNGQLVVDCMANFIKYVWLELHPQNETNKWRDKGRRAEFKRVDIEYVSPHVQLMKMDLAADAEDYVRKLDQKTLTNLAAAFGMNVSLSLGDMKIEMRRLARLKPEEVMFKAPDKSMANMLNVMHALNMGVVDYNPDKMEYWFPEDQKPFYIVPLDATPLESVAQFLATAEGRTAMDELEGLLSYWPSALGE